jgi:hypothetical protein
MDWGSALYIIYLLGMLYTIVILTKPIRRIMGADQDPQHADEQSSREANIVDAFVILGVGLLWFVTLPMYGIIRFLPASMPEAEEIYGIEVTQAERYGTPE